MSKVMENFNDEDLSKALGFKLPTGNIKQIINNLPNEKFKHVYFIYFQTMVRKSLENPK